MRQMFVLLMLTAVWQLPASAHEKPSSALVIQADFSGVVMAGVAYSVSRDLEIFNIRPLIPLYDITAASESLAYNAQSWPAGTVFSNNTNSAKPTIHQRFITPPKNSSPIRNQQQPTQNAP